MSPQKHLPRSDALVPGAHRTIRVIGTDEGPLSGTLIANGEGAVAVAVPLEEMEQWPGWHASGAAHVLAPLDIRRRAGGMDVLVPWCRERLLVFLARRRGAGKLLAAGEIVTVAASLLRGTAELRESPEITGEWWLTDEGRPIFVPGEGTGSSQAAEKILRLLAEGLSDRALSRTLLETAAALSDPAHRDRAAGSEDRFFVLAAPRALELDAYAPETVDVLWQRMMRPEQTEQSAEGPSPSPAALLTTVRNRLSDGLRWLTGVRAQLRERRKGTPADHPGEERQGSPSGAKKTLVAAAAAGMVVLFGVLWPGGEGKEDRASADPSETKRESRASVALAPPLEEQPVVAEGELPTEDSRADPQSAAGALLDRLVDCAVVDDESCTEALATAAALPEASALRGSEETSIMLIEDYGDIAVFSLTPLPDVEGAAHMMVLVRENENWLVRDVYDVAHQPVSG